VKKWNVYGVVGATAHVVIEAATAEEAKRLAEEGEDVDWQIEIDDVVPYEIVNVEEVPQ